MGNTAVQFRSVSLITATLTKYDLIERQIIGQSLKLMFEKGLVAEQAINQIAYETLIPGWDSLAKYWRILNLHQRTQLVQKVYQTYQKINLQSTSNIRRQMIQDYLIEVDIE